jgi:hypothetical protein
MVVRGGTNRYEKRDRALNTSWYSSNSECAAVAIVAGEVVRLVVRFSVVRRSFVQAPQERC